MIQFLAKRLALLAAAAALASAGIVGGGALAQDGEDRSRFVRLIEGLVSTPDRDVTLSGLQGAFSSSPTVERITVSDADGVWLEMQGVAVVWSRTALFRRTLDIDSLRAEQVTVLRKPVAGRAESGGGGLPVDVILDAFALPSIAIAGPVAGTAAELSAEGSATVTEGTLAARLSVLRLDRPGQLSADLRLEPEDNALTADLQFAEPAGGFVADLLELRGRPAVSLALAGTGPLASWAAKLNIDADSARVLAGDIAIARAEDGHRVTADLVGALEAIAPEAYANLLKGESRLAFDITRREDGALGVHAATLRSEGVELAASGDLAPDLVPRNADLTLNLGQAGRTVLPFIPGAVSVTTLQATLGLDEGDAPPWRVELRAGGLESTFGRADDLALSGTGRASNFGDSAARALSFRVEGSAGGILPDDPALARALGGTVRLASSGDWASGRPVNFTELQMVLQGASASFTGTANATNAEGRFDASATDLARFVPLAGRPLAGSAQIKANGRVGLRSGGFDLDVEGAASDLGIGVAALDPLLAGRTVLRGGVAREGEALSFEAFTLSSDHAEAVLSGTFADPALDLGVEASVANLSSLTPRAEGRATITAKVTGTMAAPEVTAEANGADIVLMGRPLVDARARFSGIVAGPRTSGRADLSGTLGDVAVKGSVQLAAGANGARTLDDLLVTVGQSRAAGALSIDSAGLLAGRVAVVSPDLSQVAPLFLVEARGMLKADVTLAAGDGAQSASISGTATDLVYETITLDSADISGQAVGLFSAPRIDGTFAIRNLRSGGLHIVAARGTAERQGRATAISAEAQLADGEARATATLEPRGNGLAVALRDFAFSRSGIDLSLAAPTTIVVEDGTALFDAASLRAGSGTVALSGRAGAALDLTARLNAVPAGLANAVSPELGAEGSISGTATLTGTPAAPSARFEAAWQGASVAASRNAGLGPVAVAAQGTLADGTVQLDSRISGAEGLAVRVAGTLGTSAGSPLDIAVTGAVPLSLGNRQLASRGAALQGALDLDLSVTGTSAAPRFGGRVTSEGGGFVDPETGVTLRDLSLAASVSGNRLVLDRLTARSGEGTVSASGSLGLEGGFPLDMRAEIRQARYVDGSVVSTRFDADLTLTGSLADGPVLGGSVFLDRTEITVPEQLPRDSVAVSVEHVNEPDDVAATLGKLREPGRKASGGGSGASGGIALDVTIKAPQQIFVRGRGLDAELGGELRLTGPIASAVADGAFEMRRGRLDVFTQRITFDRGIVTFAGDLDPVLDFAGSTQSEDVTVTVSVAGQASDPEVTFSSVPELPQDEVLAHLIFERGLDELSPVQIARLADAAAGLGGGGGLLNQLRASTGLDDLDIVTDAEGAPAVAAGRYVSENVYLGVQGGTSAESSRVTIDLDITNDVKARAAVTPQGNSSLGVFFEREY